MLIRKKFREINSREVYKESVEKPVNFFRCGSKILGIDGKNVPNNVKFVDENAFPQHPHNCCKRLYKPLIFL